MKNLSQRSVRLTLLMMSCIVSSFGQFVHLGPDDPLWQEVKDIDLVYPDGGPRLVSVVTFRGVALLSDSGWAYPLLSDAVCFPDLPCSQYHSAQAFPFSDSLLFLTLNGSVSGEPTTEVVSYSLRSGLTVGSTAGCVPSSCASYAFMTGDSAALYRTACTHLEKSFDGGVTWASVGESSTAGIASLLLARLSRSPRLYATTGRFSGDASFVLRSNDEFRTQDTALALSGGVFSAAVQSIGDTLIVYVSMNDAGAALAGLHRSTNGGDSWTRPITGTNIHTFTASDDLAKSFCASADTIFRSFDGGVTWSVIAGLPSTQINDLQLDRSGDTLFVATSSGVYTLTGSPTVVETDPPLLPSITIGQNYPNPFNPSTTIGFRLDERAHVLIEVFDLVGRRVETLRDMPMPAGTHEVFWEPTALSSGVYICRVRLIGLERGETIRSIQMQYVR